MKKITRIVLPIIALITASQTANAQARGYLGHKTYVTYSLDFWANGIALPNGITAFQDEDHSPFMDFKHTAQIHHCISRKWMATGGVSFQRAPMKRFGEINYNGSTYSTLSSKRENYMTNGLELNAGFRYYSNIIAPVGRYYGFRLGYAMYSGTYDFSDYYNGANEMPSEGEERISSSSLRFYFDVGATRVIESKYILEYGIQFGLALTGSEVNSYEYLMNGSDDYFEYNQAIYSFDDFSSSSYNDQVAAHLPAIHSAHGFFLLHFAVGYLL
ncbi:hypothetical protein [Phaeocystidibacter marisrubri]|uniref:Outer membrane beta-barrel protein n=1 Tax=Phaeocystidibacter marisrubri TaxID=1577780 RepID=A0A6L3ZKD3_9FLAO|nr:hypothetical protein [Phaeocystidibacter marisrubri]KAB2818109.1 hypothetical protein F8C82_06820 [Phaeocystidibacter marisrubri]GGH71906.1 hypothetical protein GCM10011318_15340 [Phaeocystidibacter marisrubri]